MCKLTTLQYDKERLKVRSHMAQQRRTLGYFTERKFSQPSVIQTLEQYGFKPNGYHKVIVSLGWVPAVAAEAERQGIELWDFSELLSQIARTLRGKRTYFTDDTLRTLQLFAMAPSNQPIQNGRGE